ncbi:hypothetical protein J2P12_02885, partial [Candidatus Bathyarchaeota archaeon]|nr:hypothetical protein [Candidatus Bathyarchaeota archaeon]
MPRLKLTLISLSLLILATLPIGLSHAISSSTDLAIISVFSPDYGSSNITDKTLAVGSQFTIDLNVNNAPTFNGYELALYYDPSYIQPVSIDPTTSTIFPNPYPVVSYTSPTGAVFLSVVNLGGASSGSGTLSHVTFKVVGVGVSPLALAAGVDDPNNARVSDGCTDCPPGTPNW